MRYATSYDSLVLAEHHVAISGNRIESAYGDVAVNTLQQQEPFDESLLDTRFELWPDFLCCTARRAADNTPPPGFVALFNGKDLTGWKGLVADPPARAR